MTQFGFDDLLAQTETDNEALALKRKFPLLPSSWDDAIPYHLKLIERCNAAFLAADPDEINRIYAEAEALGEILQGRSSGLLAPDGVGTKLASVTDWLGRVTTYGYDAASNLTRTSYPNQAALAFAYDASNRLTEVRNTFRKGEEDNDPNPIARFRYVLDPVGNRLQVSDGSGKVTRYGYDALYELTSVSPADDQRGESGDTSGATRFTYDAVGNRIRLTAPGKTISYSYDAADRLLAAGTATFTYDANGNQISKTQTATGLPIVYNYDAANRLIRVVGGVFTSSFSYDGDGNRISQSTRAGTYNYLNEVATALPVVLQESGPDGNISYAHGLGLISESSFAFDFFYHYDGLGSVVGLTDPKGRLEQRYSYDAWGQSDQNTDDNKIGTRNKFRFTGEALDPGTQLYYLRARYYDPSVGRFTGRDPFPGIAHFPSTSNRYEYALSDPIHYSDAHGLTAQDTSPGIRAYTDALTIFQLPNTVLNPRMSPPPESPVELCYGITDCLTYSLSAASTLLPNLDILGYMSFSAGTASNITNSYLSGTSKAVSISIGAVPVVVGLFNPLAGAVIGGGEFAVDTVLRVSPQVVPITTPAVAQPTGPFYLAR